MRNTWRSISRYWSWCFLVISLGGSIANAFQGTPVPTREWLRYGIALALAIVLHVAWPSGLRGRSAS